MAGLPSVTINRRTGGLGRVGDSENGYSALCMNGIAVSGGAALNTPYELNNVNDAVALGLDEAYDDTNSLLVYYHISEFFRMNPVGKLFIMLVAQTVTLTQMADVTTTNGLAKLLRDPKCGGKVRQAAICRNPATDFTPTTANGIDSDSVAVSAGVYSGAIVKAQALAEAERVLHRPVHIFVEGRSLNGTTADLIDVTAAAVACPKVQLVLMADNDVSVAKAIYAGHAAVGTVLGHRSAINIGQSIAFVQIGNIQDAALGKFVNPGLSSGTKLSAFTDSVNGDQDVIYNKGFIAPRVFQGYPGVFINGDRTCVVNSDDFARGSYNMVVNEAERIVYKTMLPHLEEDLKVDATTGRLAPVVVRSWEAECDEALSVLVGGDNTNVGNASGVKTYIDPTQNFLSNETIIVQINIVPKGHAKTITVYIGFKNPFNS